MSVLSFLTDLEQRQIRLWADGDQLRCNAPVGVLTPLLRGELKQRKEEILAFLRAAEESSQGPRAIVPLQRSGTQPPVFAVPGHNGDVFTFRTLAEHLGDDQPFFGLQPPGLDVHSQPITRVEDLADYFANQVLAAHSGGPCIVAAYCAGGSAAFELAQRLQKNGVDVRLLALFGCRFPISYRWLWGWKHVALTHAHRMAARRSVAGVLGYLAQVWENRRAAREEAAHVAHDPVIMRRSRLESITLSAVRHYQPTRFEGRAALFLPNSLWARSGTMPLKWRSIISSTDVYCGPDDVTMDVMLREPSASTFADFFRQARDRATAHQPNRSS